MDYSLFPNKEEWGTGDEAMDNRLSQALKKVCDSLSMESISEFYFYGISLKPRAYNPAFQMTIELVTKAFLFCFSPDQYNNQLMTKIKGRYLNKKKISFSLPEAELIIAGLKNQKNFRYKNQIDFYLHFQPELERNPFVHSALNRLGHELHTKIILKDFKAYLNGDKDAALHTDPLFVGLRKGEHLLIVENFAELWYHEDQVFSLPLFKL